MSFHVINPTDKDWTPSRFVLGFGAYGWTVCLVWANHLEDALDECIDWITDNAPGLLCNEAVEQQYNYAIGKGLTEEEAWETATEDVTTGGNHGDHIISSEWFLLAENPDRATLKSIVARHRQ